MQYHELIIAYEWAVVCTTSQRQVKMQPTSVILHANKGNNIFIIRYHNSVVSLLTQSTDNLLFERVKSN